MRTSRYALAILLLPVLATCESPAGPPSKSSVSETTVGVPELPELVLPGSADSIVYNELDTGTPGTSPYLPQQWTDLVTVQLAPPRNGTAWVMGTVTTIYETGGDAAHIRVSNGASAGVEQSTYAGQVSGSVQGFFPVSGGSIYTFRLQGYTSGSLHRYRNPQIVVHYHGSGP